MTSPETTAGGDGPHALPIVPGRVLVPADQADEAAEILGDDGRRLGFDELASWYRLGEGQLESFSQVLDNVGVLEVRGDALETVLRLRHPDREPTVASPDPGPLRARDLESDDTEARFGDEVPLHGAAFNGVDARPLYEMWPAHHYGYLPGEDPGPPLDPAEYPAPALPQPTGASTPVYVIDSGYRFDTPWEPTPSVVEASTDDIDPTSPSHGTFVTWLIRQLAPMSRVTVLRVAFNPLQGNGSVGPNGDWPRYDELGVSTALQTVGNALGANDQAVVNLSLGTTVQARLGTDEDGNLLGPKALESTLETFLSTHANATVVAAAGNDWPVADDQTTVFPAAYEGVVGVGASDGEIDDRGGAAWYLWILNDDLERRWRVYTSARPAWLDILGPALRIIGPTGPNEIRGWSGSSFAAAIMSGLLANDPGYAATVIANGDIDPIQTR